MTSPSAAVWEEYDAITGLVRAIEQRQGEINLYILP